MDSPWPMYCHDVRHTGRSPYSSLEYPIEKWRYNVENGGYGSPTIDANGIIYFGGFKLHAVYPNGTLKWTSDDWINIHSCPAIAQDGTIYVGDAYGHYFYAFNPDGTIKWKCRLWGVFSSPVIGEDGVIYISSQDTSDPPLGSIRALYPNGTIKWSFQTNHFVYSSPAIGDDGTIYCGSHDQNLYALYPNNGTEKWHYHTDHWIRTSPCIGDDGTIYVVSLDEYLHAIYPNGTFKWKTFCGAGTSPTIGKDGTVYCGYNPLYAINPDGTVEWTCELGPGRKIQGSTPCTDADGVIYFGTSIDDLYGGEIIAVNLNGTERWRKLLSNDYVEAAPCIAEDGTIYIVSKGFYNDLQVCYLHAFGDRNNTPPVKPDRPNGPLEGNINTKLTYTTVTIDSDSWETLWYLWDWDDGNLSGWIGPYDSGEKMDATHTWTGQGSYGIRVRAKDTYGAESNWSDPLEVTMPKSKKTMNDLPFPSSNRFQLLEWVYLFSNYYSKVSSYNLDN